jgi:acyl-coenzyme A thioesterase PaaI-like protein
MSAVDYLALMPFAQALGMRIETAEPGAVVGTLEWSPERCTAGGALHAER